VLLLVALGVVEWRVHIKHLSRIPIRIHVNGTRGKSSVVRLIAAGLREGSVRTLAKTSGSQTMLILPDGRETPIPRASQPNVIEQLRIVSSAASCHADALVIECMALDPALQSLSSRRLVGATHGVITNVGPDHLDVMGPDESSVALALAGSIPEQGKLFTAERRFFHLLLSAAEDRGTAVRHVREERDPVSADDLARFGHVEHAENVALALCVCEDIGVDRQTALRGMWRSRCDAGAMTTLTVEHDGRSLFFVNSFGANDPQSAQSAWNLTEARFGNVETRIVLMNCRGDRPDRSRQLGTICASWHDADHFLACGEGARFFVRAMVGGGVSRDRIHAFHDLCPDDVFRDVLALAGRSTLLMGIGNIRNGGMEFASFLRAMGNERVAI